MTQESALAVISTLCTSSHGVFSGSTAYQLGVSRDRLGAMQRAGVIARVHPDTYRLIAVRPSNLQRLHAALLWGGPSAAAARRSAGEVYALEGVRTARPEIVVPRGRRMRSRDVVVRRVADLKPSMIRHRNGIRVTGVEATLVALAAVLDDEAFEIACEDARRRRLTSVTALRTYVERFGKQGVPGVAATRRLLDELDPVHPSRSTLEVKTRRLLVAHGCTDFVREFPLTWNGRTRSYDFAFAHQKVILETNGRRWHDDPMDYEDDQEKWSVPGRLGYRVVFATWHKVTRRPLALVEELRTTLAAWDLTTRQM
jgi:hypothetical protein